MSRIGALAARLPFRQVGGFAGLQLLAAIAPLTVLPVVTRQLGVSGWVALSLGLSIGAIAACVVNLGWSVRGPGLVASARIDEAGHLYRQSLLMRGLVALPTLVLAAVVAALSVAEADRAIAAAMAIATGSLGLTSGWFFLGRGRPAGVALGDVLPRLICALLALPALLFTHQPLLYPALLAIGSAASCLASSALIGIEARGASPEMPEAPAERRAAPPTIEHRPTPAPVAAFSGIVTHLPLVASGLVVAAYGALAVPLTAASGASAVSVAAFAAVVRLRGMAQVGVGAVSAGFQGWALSHAAGTSRSRRMRAALTANLVVGIVVGSAFAVAAPAAVPLVFGPGVALDAWAAVLGGAAIVAYSASASLTNHVLAPLGRLHAITLSTAAAAVCAVPLLLFAGRVWGAAGAMAAVFVAELVVVVVQSVAARGALAHEDRRSRPLSQPLPTTSR